MPCILESQACVSLTFAAPNLLAPHSKMQNTTGWPNLWSPEHGRVTEWCHEQGSEAFWLPEHSHLLIQTADQSMLLEAASSPHLSPSPITLIYVVPHTVPPPLVWSAGTWPHHAAWHEGPHMRSHKRQDQSQGHARGNYFLSLVIRKIQVVLIHLYPEPVVLVHLNPHSQIYVSFLRKATQRSQFCLTG